MKLTSFERGLRIKIGKAKSNGNEMVEYFTNLLKGYRADRIKQAKMNVDKLIDFYQ
jgi:hypothetical protein